MKTIALAGALCLLFASSTLCKANSGPLDHAIAITTYLQFITEDDVDQRTRLDLLVAQNRSVGKT